MGKSKSPKGRATGPKVSDHCQPSNSTSSTTTNTTSSSAKPLYPTASNPLRHIDTVSIKDIKSPKWFYDNYVSKRIPVKVIGHITDETWKGEKWVDFDYLASRSGIAIVKVETKVKGANHLHAFGNGVEKRMTFVDFINDIGSGKENLYLTTQSLDLSPEGEPAIVAPPISYLKGDYPWVPSIMGNLVVQNINMWIGRSKDGSSSGLHHDHHDNLYILLLGKKTFKLYSPDEVHRMYTYGDVQHIHPNGRINYKGEATRADGADIKAVKAQQASEALEKAVTAEEEVDICVIHVDTHIVYIRLTRIQ